MNSIHRDVKNFTIIILLSVIAYFIFREHFEPKYETLSECVAKESSHTNSDAAVSWIVDYCSDLIGKKKSEHTN